MIFYNMRYRGPYEYEKFILNILQYTNIVNEIAHDTSDVDMWDTLNSLTNQVDHIFNEIVGDNKLCDKVYRKFIMIDRSEV